MSNKLIKAIQSFKIEAAKKLKLKFAEAATDKGVLQYDGDLVDGTDVFMMMPDGVLEPAPDGEYIHEDGREIIVVDGRVAEIRGEANMELNPTEAEAIEDNVTDANVVDVVSEVVEVIKDIADEVVAIEEELVAFRKMSKEFAKLKADFAAATRPKGAPVTTTTKQPEQFKKVDDMQSRREQFMQFRK